MGVMIALSRLSELLLISGNDIPFPEAQITIHPPRLKEIAYFGEDVFLIGLELWKFTKEILNDEDKVRLSHLSDFSIFMQILLDKNKGKENRTDCAFMFLSLVFPQYQFSFYPDKIVFHLDEKTKDGEINENNFSIFQELLKEMFPFKGDQEVQFNPQGTLAEKIAEKLKNRQKKLAAQQSQKSSNQKVAIFSRYISILTVGLQIDLNDLLNYTVYQVLDIFERLQLKNKFDIYLRSRWAGASSQDLGEPEDWMKDLYTSEFKGAYEKK